MSLAAIRQLYEDAPVGPIRDQRVMVGLETSRTVEDVGHAWEAWVERHGLGLRRRNGDPSTDLRTSRKVVVAYVSGGKWIADCPGCNGGIACWGANPRGCCLDCGTIYRVDFPDRDEVEAVERVLGARPSPLDRHWHRHLGETIQQLEGENARLFEAHAHDLLTRGSVSLADVERVLGRDAVEKLVAD